MHSNAFNKCSILYPFIREIYRERERNIRNRWDEQWKRKHFLRVRWTCGTNRIMAFMKMNLSLCYYKMQFSNIFPISFYLRLVDKKKIRSQKFLEASKCNKCWKYDKCLVWESSGGDKSSNNFLFMSLSYMCSWNFLLLLSSYKTTKIKTFSVSSNCVYFYGSVFFEQYKCMWHDIFTCYEKHKW